MKLKHKRVNNTVFYITSYFILKEFVLVLLSLVCTFFYKMTGGFLHSIFYFLSYVFAFAFAWGIIFITTAKIKLVKELPEDTN